jgi:hypothetical protein
MTTNPKGLANASQKIDSNQKEIAEAAIFEARKTVDYNTVEYPLEYFTDKISQEEIDNYLDWDKSQQSYFIESLMLGLPVLNIVFVDRDSDDDWSELEKATQLIDGRQRLYTALNFINGNLKLENLKKLTALNSFSFKDLTLPRQRKFKRISVRAIALSPNSDKSVYARY